MKITANELREMLREIKGKIIVLQSVENLEYHNKNWLANDNKVRSEKRQEL